MTCCRAQDDTAAAADVKATEMKALNAIVGSYKLPDDVLESARRACRLHRSLWHAGLTCAADAQSWWTGGIQAESSSWLPMPAVARRG